MGGVVRSISRGLGDIGRILDPLDITGLRGEEATRDATRAQVQGAQNALDLQKAVYEDQKQQQAPFREAGLTAQNRLLELLGLEVPRMGPNGQPLPAAQRSADFGKYARDFGMSDFQQDPGYSFRLSEGLKALDRQAAARGGLISGAALKASQRYGQDMASQEYQNAFNRYQVNRSNQINPLQGFLGQGQSATNALGQAGQNYAGAGSDLYTGIGNARASGYIGNYNAQQGGVNRLLDIGGMIFGGR